MDSAIACYVEGWGSISEDGIIQMFFLSSWGIRWQEINENRRDELVLLSASRIKKKIFATASMIAAPT